MWKAGGDRSVHADDDDDEIEDRVTESVLRRRPRTSVTENLCNKTV